MLIPNSLRMEHMPQMIYVIIKLISTGEYTEEEIRKRITASMSKDYNDNSKDRFSLLLSFAKEGGMITETNGIFKTEFTNQELVSLPEFTYSLLGKINLDPENMFNMMLKNYLSQDQHFESEFTITATAFREKITENSDLKKFHIEDDNVHGFLFWTEAFRISNFESFRSGHVYYCLENLLLEYVKKHPELREMGSIPVKMFLDKLSQDLYFIPYCCEENGNLIKYPLSQALRILHHMECITIEYRNDSDQIWHLPMSGIFTEGNHFTNVRIN